MRIIKVSATNSTNSFAKEMYRNNNQRSPFCVWALEQQAGRGQRGASWHSNPGENLTFSMVQPDFQVSISQQFVISAAVAVAIYDALEFLNLKNLKIKWPNDILADKKKICGILIENFLSNGRITASIIGIGLNVNQQIFDGLPQASSLSVLKSEKFDLDFLLKRVLSEIESKFEKIKAGDFDVLMQQYHQHLFKIQKPSTFQLPDKSYFIGIIEGVAASGELQVRVADEQIKEFDIKEVKLLF